MCIVTGGTGDTTAVHDALHEIVALHTIFVRRAVREVVESGLTKRAVFEFPEIPQPRTDVIPDRPVVIFSVNGIGQRLPLRVALYACVICRD